MNAKERIDKCQDRLLIEGVRDVKFYFNHSSETPLSQVVSDAAHVLESVLDKKCKKADLIDDSYGLKP
jgi:hypothetical protein